MKQMIGTHLAPQAIGTYSQAIKAGNTVYLSGQIPLIPGSMELLQGDFKSQVRQIFENISAVSEAAGGNLTHIVKLTIYLLDMDNFSKVNEVMPEYFQEPYPARAIVGIAKLPKNVPIEIDAILVLGD